MAHQAKKLKVENLPLLINVPEIKEEFDEPDFIDDKVNVFETAITVPKVESPYHIMDDEVKHDAASTILEGVKAEPSSSTAQHNMASNNIKTEAIDVDDMKMEFSSGLLYCEPCHSYYDDYCNKCGMLVYILNRIVLNKVDNRGQKDLPNDILELQHSFGEIGIFALKVIPGGVKFGPFVGLTRPECVWKIKGGKFVIDEDKRVYLNWMQYVNPAKNTSEQNLLVFQFENNLYYQSTRQINEGEELLVYFGEEYQDSLNKSDEVAIIPTTEHLTQDVYACTFCCLGFSSKFYMEKHKTVCLEDSAGGFSTEDLAQCPVCKIYLDQQEYSELHETYCRDRNAGKCILPIPISRIECQQCKYTTNYKADLRNHANHHYKVKMYKCEICNRRFKFKESLKLHVENRHMYVGQEHSTDDYLNTYIKSDCPSSQDDLKRFKCSLCQFRTKNKRYLKGHIKTRHLEEFSYKCETCQYSTNYKTNLNFHIKSKHLKEYDHKCASCTYKTNKKSDLVDHVRRRHLKVFDYGCELCQYKTSCKDQLESHVKAKHFKQFDYKCDMCDYEANRKWNLERHLTGKHAKELFKVSIYYQ